jgi:hypothetical protein
MKRFFKPLLLIALFVVLTVLVLVPAKSNAADVTQLPGRLGSGQYGLTCRCPQVLYINCGCAVFQQ